MERISPITLFAEEWQKNSFRAKSHLYTLSFYTMAVANGFAKAFRHKNPRPQQVLVIDSGRGITNSDPTTSRYFGKVLKLLEIKQVPYLFCLRKTGNSENTKRLDQFDQLPLHISCTALRESYSVYQQTKSLGIGGVFFSVDWFLNYCRLDHLLVRGKTKIIFYTSRANMTYAAKCAKNRSVACIELQHGALGRNQIVQSFNKHQLNKQNLDQGYFESYLADTFIVYDRISMDIQANFLDFSDVRYFGDFRRIEGTTSLKSKSENFILLTLSRGELNQGLKLINEVNYSCAKNELPLFQITIRLHPLDGSLDIKHLPKNVSLSKYTLEEELKICSAHISFSSSSIFDAQHFGIKNIVFLTTNSTIIVEAIEEGIAIGIENIEDLIDCLSKKETNASPRLRDEFDESRFLTLLHK